MENIWAEITEDENQVAEQKTKMSSEQLEDPGHWAGCVSLLVFTCLYIPTIILIKTEAGGILPVC